MMQEWSLRIARSVDRSIAKSSLDANLTARIMRTGSSRNRIIGSPMERMSRFLRSLRPPTQSITANVLMS